MVRRHGRPNPHFEHLFQVCREAVRRGDTHLAETLLVSYRDEARRLQEPLRRRDQNRHVHGRRTDRRDGAQRHQLIDEAKEKAVRLAKLLSRSLSEPGLVPSSNSSTAQTVVHARRRRDPLANMRLSRCQERAAAEIRHVFESLVRGLFARTADYSRIVERRTRSMDPIDLVTEKVAALRKERYLPWVRRQQTVVARVKVPGIPLASNELSAIQLVIAVLIDLEPLSALEKRFGVKHGTLGEVFRAALDSYADIAGFGDGKSTDRT